MKLTRDQTRVLAAAAGLEIPDEDLESVTLRVSALLESMEQIEAELGDRSGAWGRDGRRGAGATGISPGRF